MCCDCTCCDEPSRRPDVWLQALHASCRMLVEQPETAEAIRVGWTLPDLCEDERDRAMALAQRVAEEYCLDATVTARDAFMSVRLRRTGHPGHEQPQAGRGQIQASRSTPDRERSR